jgi:hypothetical protein
MSDTPVSGTSPRHPLLVLLRKNALVELGEGERTAAGCDSERCQDDGTGKIQLPPATTHQMEQEGLRGGNSPGGAARQRQLKSLRKIDHGRSAA